MNSLLTRLKLYEAMRDGDVTKVEQLVHDGASKGDALRMTAEHGRLSVVKMLIRLGVDVNSEDPSGRTALSHAASKGHVDIVAALIGHGAKVNGKDASERTALSYAAAEGHVDVVKMLIEHGAKVDAKDKSKRTPLSFAAEHGHLDVIVALIKREADVNATDDDGWTALTFAASDGNVDVVAALIDHGANVDAKGNDGRTPLLFAAQAGHLDVVVALIKRKADVNAKSSRGRTALSHAAEKGRTGVVAALVGQGADVDTTDNNGWTALTFAASEGHADVVTALVKHGANADAKDNDGWTPLFFPAFKDSAEVATVLITHGADANTKDTNKWTPLFFAAVQGNVNVADALIRLGADVNAKDNDGCTALSHAVQKGRVKVVAALIKHGANVDTKDSDGRTPLLVAAQAGQLAVVVELARLNADVNATDKCGRTALSHAAEKGYAGVVAALIKRKADVSVKDGDGNTALSYAESHEQLDVAKILISLGTEPDATDKKGRTALLRAARDGDAEKVVRLIKRGADVDAKDKGGRTALLIAAKEPCFDMTKALIRFGADVNASDQNGRTALSYVAAWDVHLESTPVNIEVAAALIERNADVDAQDKDGRTALFVAAEYGQVDIVKLLIRRDVNVAAKLHVSLERPREYETPLTLAGRNGHMKVWQALVQADSPVNVRSNVDGETPLISVARSDFFPAVQQLIARGGYGVLCVEDARDDEYPLLPGSLATMTTMCATVAFEFEDVYSRLLRRLQDVCDQLQQQQRSQRQDAQAARSVTHDTLVAFARILFRACCLLLDIEDKATTLARFVASRVVLQRVQGIHEELKHFAALYQLTRDGASGASKDQQSSDEDELQRRFEQTLLGSDDRAVKRGCRSDSDSVHKLAVLLQYELAVRQQQKDIRGQALIQRVLDRFVRVCKLKTVPDVPAWFISLDDLEFHGWSDMEATRHGMRYHGKWCGTNVLIETSEMSEDDVTTAVDVWRRLRHPNILKLYGACHVGRTRVFVYEAVPDAMPLRQFLHEFLRDVSAMDEVEFEQVAAQWRLLSLSNVTNLVKACHMDISDETDSNATPLQTSVRNASKQRRLWQRLYKVHMWKCLHEAALGLKYLHDQGVAHGSLVDSAIIIGSDGVTKLANVGGSKRELSGEPMEHCALEFDTHQAERTASADIYAFGICIWAAAMNKRPPGNDGDEDEDDGDCTSDASTSVPRMTKDQYDLLHSMCKGKQVDIAFVVNRLKRFDLNESEQVGSGEATTASIDAKIQSQSQQLDEYEFPDLGHRSIPNALAHIKTRCEDLPDTQWMLDSVLPALAFVFGLLLEREKTPLDATVATFCAAVARLQRYVRTAVSNKSMYERIRSRKVAESHHLVYTQLDQLLDMLEVEATHSIRVWRHEAAPSILNPVDLSDVRVQAEGGVTTTTTVTDTNKPSKNPSDAITLNHLNTPPAVYEQWTRDGLFRAWVEASTEAAASSLSSANGTPLKRPPWYLSLKQLTFNESSDKIGKGAFGAVYRGSWRGTPVVIKFMGFEEDIETISTDLLLHEVRVWHRLKHPHVLEFYGASHVDKRYFVCEFAGNGELRAYLARVRQQGEQGQAQHGQEPSNSQEQQEADFNDHLTWQKLHEAALGLQYLHGMNVAHNDLKCDNIMVGSDHKAKLIDFGLSCLIGEAEVQIAINKIGAVNWRSPEYLAGGRPSFASDVYSFAMCIIEAVSGEPPWGRNPVQAGQVRFWLRRGMSPPLPASMTPKQRNLIELMTKFDPSKRVKIEYVANMLSEIAQDASEVK